MAAPPTDPGGVQPRFRRFIAVDGVIYRGDHDAGDYAATDFADIVGTGVPTLTLPGSMTRGLFRRTDGSIPATLYLTVNGGGTWVAV